MGSIRDNFYDIFRRDADHFASLDGLRAIAVLLVAAFHTVFLSRQLLGEERYFELIVSLSPGWNWIWQGDKGVDLFFVLSGFLISHLLLKELIRDKKINFVRYFKRRAARILPAYLVLLSFAWLLELPNRENIWANLLFVNNEVYIDKLFVPWSWSIAVEVQFYLFFPLVYVPLVILMRRPVFIAVLFLVLSLFLRFQMIAAHPDLYTRPFYHLMFENAQLGGWMEAIYVHFFSRSGALFVGVLMGALYNYHPHIVTELLVKRRWASKIIPGMALSMTAFSLCIPLHDASNEYFRHIGDTGNLWLLAVHRVVFAGGAGIILLYSLVTNNGESRISAVLGHRCWAPFAKVSYSLYLYHILVIGWVYDFFLPKVIQVDDRVVLSVLLGGGAMMLISFLVACISYAVVEKPFMRLAR